VSPSTQYPVYEVTKFYIDKDDNEHLVGEIIVAVTSDQEQKLTGLEVKDFVRFIGWSRPGL